MRKNAYFFGEGSFLSNFSICYERELAIYPNLVEGCYPSTFALMENKMSLFSLTGISGKFVQCLELSLVGYY